LWAALILPAVWVAVGLHLLRDVRITVLLYVAGGCLLTPRLLLNQRPWDGRGLPFADRSRGLRAWLLAQAFVCGPLFVLAYWLLRPLVGDPGQIVAALSELGWQHDQRVLYAAVFVLLVPLAEEWWWRGRALPLCEVQFGAQRGRWINALSFSLYHLLVLWMWYPPAGIALRMLVIGGAGRFWAELAGRRKSWGLAYAGHLAADVGIAAVYLWSMA
jgi:hypothetical protein